MAARQVLPQIDVTRQSVHELSDMDGAGIAPQHCGLACSAVARLGATSAELARKIR